MAILAGLAVMSMELMSQGARGWLASRGMSQGEILLGRIRAIATSPTALRLATLTNSVILQNCIALKAYNAAAACNPQSGPLGLYDEGGALVAGPAGTPVYYATKTLAPGCVPSQDCPFEVSASVEVTCPATAPVNLTSLNTVVANLPNGPRPAPPAAGAPCVMADHIKISYTIRQAATVTSTRGMGRIPEFTGSVTIPVLHGIYRVVQYSEANTIPAVPPSWTVPENVSEVLLTLIGGGGSGGNLYNEGATTTSCCVWGKFGTCIANCTTTYTRVYGGGGGASGDFFEQVVSVTAGATLANLKVGAGGAGAAAGQASTLSGWSAAGGAPGNGKNGGASAFYSGGNGGCFQNCSDGASPPPPGVQCGFAGTGPYGGAAEQAPCGTVPGGGGGSGFFPFFSAAGAEWAGTGHNALFAGAGGRGSLDMAIPGKGADGLVRIVW